MFASIFNGRSASKSPNASVANGLGSAADSEAQEDGQGRTDLPAPPRNNGNLLSFLKKNMFKDLSTVSFPASFNEPLTLLQRCAEELEYYHLLDQAAATTDPIERFCLVAAFAVSGYAHTRYRRGRKNFTPLLGETFEHTLPGVKFVAEKVSHHPLIIAYHAQSADWKLHATNEATTKFTGKSMEITPTGSTRLILGEDYYSWDRPSTLVKNIISGTKYFEHKGDMTIQNLANESRCVLTFKERGSSPSPDQCYVTGVVFSPTGDALATLQGNWDSHLASKPASTPSAEPRTLWRAKPFPANACDDANFGFTSYALALNDLNPDVVRHLPPTDSRLRPDVRAMEHGDMDGADKQKTRLEEDQRARRKAGKDREPQYFTQVGPEWMYIGGYWEQRESGTWEDPRPLF